MIEKNKPGAQREVAGYLHLEKNNLFFESRGKLPIVIASGLILWLPLLDSHVESAYIIIGNRIAPCTKILELELK